MRPFLRAPLSAAGLEQQLRQQQQGQQQQLMSFGVVLGLRSFTVLQRPIEVVVSHSSSSRGSAVVVVAGVGRVKLHYK